jgi:osmotically-inducible protein OsmY
MKFLSKNLLPCFITAILAMQSQNVVAVDRPSDVSTELWVKEAISEDPYMDASGITVDVSDGIVILSGTVKNIATRKHANLEAKKIRGVLGVVDKLKVTPSYRWDMDIAQDVRHRIVNSVAIESGNIKVTCTHGTVELTGKVGSWSEREEADLIASEVRGVKDVQDYLSLSWDKNRPDEAIQKDVVAALDRDVYLTDLPIDVSVKKGTVTLTGSVGSDYEKTRAADDIRWINNVTGLNNKLQVEWWEIEGTRTKTAVPTDNDLRYAVTESLVHDSRLEPLDLVVKVYHGHVTLEGSVANTYQKQMAGADASNVVGIAWTTNHLSVRPVKRDDSEIRDDVTYEILNDDALFSQNVIVKVDNGVVTLSGKVDTGYDRVHATTVASRIRGVREVVNNIHVDWTHEYADAAIFKKIWDRIESNWLLSPVEDKIKFNVKKGVVTLTGTVYNWGERSEAEHLALNTNGVRLVNDELQVEGYNYDYEDWKISDPDNPSLAFRDIDPYQG